MISYGRQYINETDIQSVVDILKSDWLTQGPDIKNFEDALCKKLNCKNASVLSNGTAALHLSALALGWKQGDIIISAPLTFAASTNCVLYAGATPDFVDIDPVSYTMDVNKLEDRIKWYISKNKKIKAVVAIDYAGHPCDWEALKSLADKYEFQLVDDACHALGAKYKGKSLCSSIYADATILSFHPVKHITTGEGGAVLTNSEELDKKIKILRTHGITKDDTLLEKNDGPWYYEMQELGFNYRLTDFQCALGLSQLNRIDSFIKRRLEIAEFYNKSFANDERIIIPEVSKDVKHVYHLYPLQIKFDKLKINRKDLFAKLKDKGINCQVHYIPVHTHPYYRKNFGFKFGDFPISEKFYEREISMPIYATLSDKDLEFVKDAVSNILNNK